MLNKLKKRMFGLLILGLGLYNSSCSFPKIYVDIINQTSESVIVSYSHAGLKTKHPLSYDTIRFEIKAGARRELSFPVMCNKKKLIEKLNKQIPFVIFEKPNKSVYIDTQDKLIKLLDKKTEYKNKYEFIISDSLFNCK